MVLGVVIGLTQSREYAIGFGTGFFADPLGDFFLKHAAKKREVLSVLQGFEYNLTRNVVREVSNNAKGLTLKGF